MEITMRRTLLALIGIVIASSAWAAVETGKPAPAFSGVDVLSGKEIALEQFKGKTIVLEWNNFECPFVHKFYSVGAMQSLQANAVKEGVVWISINSSALGKEGYLKDAPTAKAAALANKSNASYYLLDHDGTIGHLYGAKTTPHMFVIDKNGTLAYEGAIDDKPTADTADIATATNYVTQALKALAAGTPVKTTKTRSYGCFVKY
jgi:peroxiredoxin